MTRFWAAVWAIVITFLVVLVFFWVSGNSLLDVIAR